MGSGWRSYADVLGQRCGVGPAVDADAMVHARDVAVLAGRLHKEGVAVPAEEAVPVYLRDQVAWAKQP